MKETHKVWNNNNINNNNNLGCPPLRYSGLFLKWTREELKQMDQRPRKLLSMQKALHPRYNVDWLSVSIREGGRELASIEDSIDTLIQWLEGYIQKQGGKLVAATRNNTNGMKTSGMTITRKKRKNNSMDALSD